MNRIIYGIIMVFLIAMSCNQRNQETSKSLIDTVAIAKHISVLSSDEFQGRKPFTFGEEKTLDYLMNEFIEMGLEPGNKDSYLQEVPMVELNAKPDEWMRFEGNKGKLDLKVSEDFVAYTQRAEEEVSLEKSEIIFAGFGIVAPEYGWNDYEGLDVKGKTVLVLVNDPGFGTGNNELFKGETMTYYGRWTYKFEEAARQGAAGVLIIHETVPAGYPWLVVRNSWSGATLNLENTAGLYQCAVQGWITRDAAIKLFEISDQDMRNFKEMAGSQGFKPIPLGVNASISIQNEIKRDISYNVAAKITGTKSPEEVIIYSAHWDHLGIGPEVDGDSIYNGAHDNASGTSLMLEIARAFAKSKKPERTVLFLAVTAEEQGLLGSAYYGQNPIFSPVSTVANLNMDGVAAYGEMKDFTIVGFGQSDMDDLAGKYAQQQGRYIYPDPNPGKGYFFRSDHFNFAKIGIPALYGSGSYEAAVGGIERIKTETEDYNANRYHRPADEYDAGKWKFGGIWQDGMVFYQVGNELANSNSWPLWKQSSEFKSIRNAK